VNVAKKGEVRSVGAFRVDELEEGVGPFGECSGGTSWR